MIEHLDPLARFERVDAVLAPDVDDQRQIPRGQVTTYGTIAALCGQPLASRAVGYALRALPPSSASATPAPVGSNPNGGIDWAVVRATQGHPEPYGVRWFEYGNESYHGGHRGSEPGERTDVDAELVGRGQG